MRKLYLLFVVALALGLSTVAFAAEHGKMFTVELSEVGDSGVSGTVTVTDNGDGTSNVSFDLDGTTEGAMHPAHFHEPGECGATNPVAVDLGTVNGDTGEQDIDVDESYDELLDSGYYLNVHMSAEDLATVIACGDEYVEMAETPDTGAGAMAQGNGASVMGLGLVAAVLAAGALLVFRPRAS